jgi:GntR family transcriptional regulator
MLAYLISRDGGVFTPTQLHDQIAAAVEKGVLKPGQRLPTARQVAVELRINVHTVQQAYDTLAEEGILTLLSGQGSFVSPEPFRQKPDHRRDS